MSTSSLWAVLLHQLHGVLRQRPSRQILYEVLWLCLICLFLPKVMQNMCLFLKYCWPMNVLSWKNVSEIFDMGFLRPTDLWWLCWHQHHTPLLELRENTGKNPKECAIKIRLPNYTDDYSNLNLHDKRLLLLVRSPDRHNTARNGISKKEPKFHFACRHKYTHTLLRSGYQYRNVSGLTIMHLRSRRGTFTCNLHSSSLFLFPPTELLNKKHKSLIHKNHLWAQNTWTKASELGML